MPTATLDALETVRASIRAKLDERSAAQAEIDTILETVKTEGRSDLTTDEDTKLGESRAKRDAADKDRADLEAREAELADDENRRAAAEATAKRIGEAPKVQAGQVTAVRVGSEPRLYRKGGEHHWMSDAYNGIVRNQPDANDRLRRHATEWETELRSGNPYGFELRDADGNTADFAGLIPPQYLLDLYAPIAKAGRPFTNTVRNLPLPATGMSAHVPKGNTPTTESAQAAQAADIAQGSFDVTDLTPSVVTIAGYQNVTRQSLERGTLTEEVVFGDLVTSYDVSNNSDKINGSGSSGTSKGVLAAIPNGNKVVYTDASPTVAELWPKLADAIQRITSTRFLPPSAIWMHPRRWGWFTSVLDSTGRPLFGANLGTNGQNFNPVAVGTAAEYGQIVGTILGLPVITDASIPTNLGSGTNQDVIIVGRAFDGLVWEESPLPRQLTFEQPLGTKLQVQLVAYGYTMATFERYPLAFSRIDGTGLVTPSF